MKITKLAYGLIVFISCVVILRVGADLLIPLILALIIWFLIKEIKQGLQRIPFIKKNIPRFIQTTVAALIIFTVSGAIINMITVNIRELSLEMPTYEKNIQKLVGYFDGYFKIDSKSFIAEYLGKIDISSTLSLIFSSLTDLFGNTFTILLYVMFLLIEESSFMDKIRAIYPEKQQFEQTYELLNKIDRSVGSYLVLKTIISVITGVASYIALRIIGVDAPVFWSVLIFVLNYIPTIGSLIATAFPALFTLLQFGTFIEGIYVLVIVGTIQLVVGNLLEPKVMGDSLNVSPLVVLIALGSWGALWGITGMFLSVPITVIMIIIFSEFNSTRAIAILLSDKGLTTGDKEK